MPARLDSWLLMKAWAERLEVTRLGFELVVERPIKLPEHPGSMLRGAVGWALKGMVCMVEDGDCGRCRLRPGCPYARVFEPARPPGVGAFRGEAQVPPPYVIGKTDRNRELAAGDRFRFELVLIGSAAGLAGHVVEAVEEAARAGLGAWRVPARVAGAVERNGRVVPLDRARLAAGLRGETVRELASRARGGDWREVEIRFETPARIVAGGRIRVRPTGPEVLRALLRRVGALAAYWGGGPVAREEWEPPARSVEGLEWEAHDVRWVQSERWSNRQRRKTPLGGVLGTYVFRGEELGRLWRPWLAAGEAVHVGKQASFGLGRFRLKAAE